METEKKRRLPALASMDSYVGDVSDRTPVVVEKPVIPKLADTTSEVRVVKLKVWADQVSGGFVGRWRTDDVEGACETVYQTLTPALLEALADAQDSVAARFDVVCGSSVVVRGIREGWPRKWAFAGWRTARGGPVKHAELWKRVRLEGVVGARYDKWS